MKQTFLTTRKKRYLTTQLDLDIDEIFGNLSITEGEVLIKDLFELSDDKIGVFQSLYQDCLSDSEKQRFIDNNIDDASFNITSKHDE